MRFDYNGVPLRIRFRHDPPLELAAHVGHQLTAAPTRGRVRVHCVDCGLTLTPLSRREARRETTCLIEAGRQYGVAITQGGEVKQLLDWTTLLVGRSRTNVKAGDRFTRALGRVSSLENALGAGPCSALPGSAEEAAWRAYGDRNRAR